MKKKGNYEKKKGKQATDVATSSAEIDYLFRRLEDEDFAMIYHFSQGTVT